MFDLSVIQKNKHDFSILTFDTLSSTNATAREQAMQGASDMTVILAEHQSGGRGRMQRTFHSPEGTGIYMSVIVRRPMTARDATHITPLAAVATAQAIEGMIHRPVGIKWVNDIYLDSQKVCGILCEGAVDPGTQQLQYAVIGIGVNVATPKDGFPEEIRHVAGSVFDGDVEVEHLRDRLIGEILVRLSLLLDGKDPTLCLSEYRRRSIVVGHDVMVHQFDSPPRPAQALEIDDEYRLIVKYENGEIAALDSGEVSVRL